MPNDETKKNPPHTFLIVRTGSGEHHLDLADLAGLLGLKEPVTELEMGLSRDNMILKASLRPREADYPGITVDGFTPQARDIYLGNFELPCETYPTRIAARLYAGCSKYETDSPIAIVTHEITDDARVMYRTSKYGGRPRPMRKLVYIDHDLAGSRTWTEPGEEHMPEHQEDE